MLKKIFLLLFIFTIIPVSSQLINSYKNITEKHVKISGSKIALIPPNNFSQSKDFSGFQHENKNNSKIFLTAIPESLSNTYSGLNARNLVESGLKTVLKKEVIVNDLKGYLYNLEQKVSELTFSKTILIFGNTSKTTMITGINLKDSPETSKSIKESILSVFVKN
ncbi:hypothetical protein OD91_0793 [Lutibacter sp. Hel_I_33_5]|uniref:hypothetical protein n=1 Tax=Lutibacter sp. Hel_I_33_5 TaxID=1566289 RepID=UPI0011A78324|nr:hypothetical protein [Lutibacter sp. Hel_I_33_5]TVZ55539.1 hypothetical protein OD91_0793 [Lutibacter sp. Hel_I_33_5]